ncbi:MAG: hypothetical protein KBC47_03025 [Candidatus Peribacteraceae bacterium]|nr:hypothetical protein [Candidatus Peribacteraceae bacterium]
MGTDSLDEASRAPLIPADANNLTVGRFLHDHLETRKSTLRDLESIILLATNKARATLEQLRDPEQQETSRALLEIEGDLSDLIVTKLSEQEKVSPAYIQDIDLEGLLDWAVAQLSQRGTDIELLSEAAEAIRQSIRESLPFAKNRPARLNIFRGDDDTEEA